MFISLFELVFTSFFAGAALALLIRSYINNLIYHIPMKYRINQDEIEIDPTRISTKNLLETGILIPVQDKSWPQVGDEYWSVTPEYTSNKFIAEESTWQNHIDDKYQKLIGNMFRTKEEAEKYRDEILSKEV